MLQRELLYAAMGTGATCLATVLGAALWSPGSPRFWISLGVGGVLTALALVIWRLRRRPA